MRAYKLLLLLVVVVVGFALSTAVAAKPKSGADVIKRKDWREMSSEDSLIALVNKVRQENSLPELSCNPKLQETARNLLQVKNGTIIFIPLITSRLCAIYSFFFNSESTT